MSAYKEKLQSNFSRGSMKKCKIFLEIQWIIHVNLPTFKKDTETC